MADLLVQMGRLRPRISQRHRDLGEASEFRRRKEEKGCTETERKEVRRQRQKEALIGREDRKNPKQDKKGG